MKSALYVIALWLMAMAAAAGAQVIVGNYGVSYVSSAPSGACAPNSPLTIVQPGGTMYTCANGTWTAAGGSGAVDINPAISGTFSVPANPSVHIWTLSAQVNLSSITGDTAGHVSTFAISQPASGPSPFFWPLNFINPTPMPFVPGAKIVASFMYDGTNYVPINFNPFQVGPTQNLATNYVRNSSNLLASTWTVTGAPTITGGQPDGGLNPGTSNSAFKIVTTGPTTFVDTGTIQLNSQQMLSCVHAKGNVGGEQVQVGAYNTAALTTISPYVLSGTQWGWYCNQSSRGNNFNAVFNMNFPSPTGVTVFVDAVTTMFYQTVYQGSIQNYQGYAPSYIATKGVQITVPPGQFASAWPSDAGYSTTAGQAFAANQTVYYGYVLSAPVTVNAIGWYTQTADATANLYDVGVYNTAGTLLFHTGALPGTTLFAVAGYKDQPVLSGPYPLPPGNYIFAVTTNCASACAAIGVWQSGPRPLPYAGLSGGVTSGGALNLTITPPTKSWALQTTNWWLALHD